MACVSEHSVVLQASLQDVFRILGTEDGLKATAKLSDLCTAFDYTTKDNVALQPQETLQSVTALRTCSPATASSSNAHLLPRQNFTLEETIPLLCGLIKKRIKLEGSLVWDEERQEALYESLTDGGISIRKYRRFEVLEETKATRVYERIDGKCQPYLKWIVAPELQRSHRAHMEQYHLLFST